MKPNPAHLARARMLYLLGCDREADLAMITARGFDLVPMSVKDQVREERAVRHWHEHRRGGWSPIDVVLRSTLHETETWYEPRGKIVRDYGFGPSHTARVDGDGRSVLSVDYAEIERRILSQIPKPDSDLSFAEMYGTKE
jgi:hypothetical protein